LVKRVVFFLLFFFPLLASCGEDQTKGTVVVRLNLILPAGIVPPSHALSEGAPSAGVVAPVVSVVGVIPTRLTMQVTGPGMSTIFLSQDIPQTGEVIININVLAGPERRFTIIAFDADENPVFQGESTTDLHPGDLSVEVNVPLVSIGDPAKGSQWNQMKWDQGKWN